MMLEKRPFLNNLVTEWNNKWRVDYWYRKKYNLPFNSPKHRAMCPIDIVIEYAEEHLINKEIKRIESLKNNKKLLEETGCWLNERLSTKEDFDRFDKLNLTELNY